MRRKRLIRKCEFKISGFDIPSKPSITDEMVVRAWENYALVHFDLHGSKPTELEHIAMRAALESAFVVP